MKRNIILRATLLTGSLLAASQSFAATTPEVCRQNCDSYYDRFSAAIDRAFLDDTNTCDYNNPSGSAGRTACYSNASALRSSAIRQSDDGRNNCKTACSVSSSDMNFVMDPGFEASTSIRNMWQIEGPNGHGIDSGLGFAHTGSNNAWVRANSWNWNALRQHVVVQPNKNYVLTAWVQTSPNFAQTGYFGVRAGDTTNVLAETRFGTLPGYTQLTVQFFSGSLTSVEVFWGNWAQGFDSWMRLDDVSLKSN
jgi:hypothetical protein